MKKLFVIFTILVLAFAFGCAKAPEPAPEPVEPAPAPQLEQVDSPEEQAVPEPEPVAEAPEAEGEEMTGPIGNRVTGEEPEVVEEEPSSEEIEEITLNPDKTMSSGDITVQVGTTLAWVNQDSWPHVLAVDSGSGFDTVRHAKSEQLTEGMVWEYTFDEKGEFLVRDLFSGPMRMKVTVE